MKMVSDDAISGGGMAVQVELVMCQEKERGYGGGTWEREEEKELDGGEEGNGYQAFKSSSFDEKRLREEGIIFLRLRHRNNVFTKGSSLSSPADVNVDSGENLRNPKMMMIMVTITVIVAINQNIAARVLVGMVEYIV
ncbi:hypothetical protein Salat_2642400 [Sesamum alatum]|uniref:Uncharacterized protein n=1 Tax=Sesamum alatum TaxID=300844 RepID=A0AAE1XNY9_9LAMI|nr:hypothetical protein Salat_2642400 [Sesamum alatum]